MAGQARSLLGLGDQLQFTSFPENFFRSTGEKLIDVDNNELFNYNPYVVRGEKPECVLDLWRMTDVSQGGVAYDKNKCILSLAEKNIYIANKILNMDLKAFLRTPRLYIHEDLKIKSNQIVVHFFGKSHKPIPEKVIYKIKENYKDFNIIQVGGKNQKRYDIFEDGMGLSIFDTAKIIGESIVFIGINSGMLNMALCYPRVNKRMVLNCDDKGYDLENMIPMDAQNGHYHWLDFGIPIFNTSEQDVGVTKSYIYI